MKWREVTVVTTTEAVEAVSQFLMELGATGVSIEDPSDIQFIEEWYGQIREPEDISYRSSHVLVLAYFPIAQAEHILHQQLEQFLQHLTTYNLSIGPGEIFFAEVSEEDWESSWKQYYHPVRLTRYLTVVPSWEQYEKQADDEQLIIIDPGLSFGTGTHPTTRLTIEAMESVMRGGETVIDVGTGSGILSIAAAKLGASAVVACDLDERATNIARENLALNDLAIPITVFENNLLVHYEQKGDVIVANILAEILTNLIPDVAKNMHDHSVLILSGIIASKRDVIMEQLSAAQFQIIQEKRMADWVTLICQKG